MIINTKIISLQYIYYNIAGKKFAIVFRNKSVDTPVQGEAQYISLRQAAMQLQIDTLELLADR